MGFSSDAAVILGKFDRALHDRLDREVAKPVLSCLLNGTRFFVSESGTATDIPNRAKVYRDLTDAAFVALRENDDPSWGRMKWAPGHLCNGVFVCP